MKTVEYIKFPDLLFRKVLCDLVLINILSTLKLLPFNLLNALTLHIASTNEHTLQSSQAKIIVTLRGKLLVAQPAKQKDLLYKRIKIFSNFFFYLGKIHT